MIETDGAKFLAALDGETARIAKRLWGILVDKQKNNMLLDAYYDAERPFQDLGIAIPPGIRDVGAALGWPAKAVRAIARKHVFEGFRLADEEDPYELRPLLEQNRFSLELPQAINSAYKHSCAFLTVTAGRVEDGEPEVMVHARDASWTAATWDTRRRQIEALIAVTRTRDVLEESTVGGTAVTYDRQVPTEVVLMLPGRVVVLSREEGEWAAREYRTPQGRVMAEAITHDPQLNRPFGRSRITPEVRYLTDAAVRVLWRAEVSGEFYASPQRYVLGADEAAFQGGKWSARMGRILALEVTETGELPGIGQFPQLTMEPHLSMYRQLAQNFCSATELPQSAVGIYADNPASAEAMQAAEASLADEAEAQWRVFAPALTRTAQNMIMLRDGLQQPPEDTWRLRIAHKPARYVSPQAAADFTVKAVGAVPELAKTDFALKGLGIEGAEMDAVKVQLQRARAGSVLEQVAQLRGAGSVDRG